MNFVITFQSGLRIHLAIASWIHSYFDDVMTKFIINNKRDVLKTDVNLLISNYIDPHSHKVRTNFYKIPKFGQ